MNENVKSQLDAELAHAGEETTLSPKMLLLEQLRTDGVPVPAVRQAVLPEAGTGGDNG